LSRLQQQLAAALQELLDFLQAAVERYGQAAQAAAEGRQEAEARRQPGHEQHLRSPFPPEAVNEFMPYTLDCCPDCGGTLVLSRRPPEVLQQVEITSTPTIVTEHQGLAYWCPHCRKFHYAPLPEAVRQGGAVRPAADGPGGLHEGRLPRLVLHDPQVPPRRGRGWTFPAATWPS
jgi:hypothetical protein